MIRVVQNVNIRILWGIRGIYRIPNARVRKLGGAKKEVDERIDGRVLRWFGHTRVIIGSPSVDPPGK